MKPLFPCLLFVISNFSSPVIADVLWHGDNGFIIENKIISRTTTEKAWKALIHNVGDWWPSDHTWWGNSQNLSIDDYAGGCFCEKSNGNSAEHMRIVYVRREKLLRMAGGLGPLQGMGMYGALDWRFDVEKEGLTTISLRYSVQGINPDGFDKLATIVDQVQAQQLNALRDWLKHKTD